jgi:hypothetical protein
LKFINRCLQNSKIKDVLRKIKDVLRIRAIVSKIGELN